MSTVERFENRFKTDRKMEFGPGDTIKVYVRVIEGEKDYEVFHDGTVILIATPGHTPGHQSMYLKLPKTGSLVLAGDLWHFPGERTFHTIPKVDMGKPSGAQTAASRAKIEALLKKTGAQLWIQHDIISNLNLKKSPLYYE